MPELPKVFGTGSLRWT